MIPSNLIQIQMSLCEQMCTNKCFYEEHRKAQQQRGGLTEAEKQRFMESTGEQLDPYQMECRKKRLNQGVRSR